MGWFHGTALSFMMGISSILCRFRLLAKDKDRLRVITERSQKDIKWKIHLYNRL